MRGVQGCWAIQVLVEVLAASEERDRERERERDAAAGPRDEVQFLMAMMTKLTEAGKILQALPARTQVVSMYDDDVVGAVCFCDAVRCNLPAPSSFSFSFSSSSFAQPDCILQGAAGGGQSVHQARRGILAANASAWRT